MRYIFLSLGRDRPVVSLLHLMLTILSVLHRYLYLSVVHCRPFVMMHRSPLYIIGDYCVKRENKKSISVYGHKCDAT